MQYKFAKQLQNNDQVTIKETGEISEVITTEVHEKDVIIYVMSSEYGYHGFHHKELA